MDRTNVYVVTRNIKGVGLSSSETPAAVFLSRRDADFYVWSKNERDSKSFSLYDPVYYTVREVSVHPEHQDGPDMKKFLKEKREEIENEIEENKKHSVEDLEKVAELEKQLENLKKP